MKSKKRWQAWIKSVFILQSFLLIKTGTIADDQVRLRLTSLAEFQLGNIPGVKPDDQSSLYEQLNLSLSYENFSLKTRLEHYSLSTFEDREYTRINQYLARYSSNNFYVNTGHFYSSLGRGLLLRTYEIPGSIWETRGYRVRYGFYKDITGIEFGYNYKNFSLQAIRGEVLDVSLPPTLEDETNRRPDLVEGGEASYRIEQQKIGVAYMRHTNSGRITEYSSIYLDGKISDNISFYGEFASSLDSLGGYKSWNTNSVYALYGSLNYSFKGLGISIEFKNYQNFSIGAGINDPPSLVKEHPYRLLNRSTHIPIVTDESGFQVDVYYMFSNQSFLTLNMSRAKNEISNEIQPVFQEYFIEYQFPVRSSLHAQVYLDYAKDPFINEDNRYSSGVLLDVDHGKLYSTLELATQYIERTTLSTTGFFNTYASYTISSASKYSASLILEHTKDPIHIEENKSYTIYPAIQVQVKPDANNQILVFYGKRRGGPACNSGVCYDVLDFEGLEIRLLTRF